MSEKKKRKIPGTAFWSISDAIEAGLKLGKKLKEWQRNYVRDHGLYLGDVNFTSGLISELKDGAAVPVGHMEQEDMVKSHEVIDAVSEANDGIEHKIRVIARRYGVRPHQLNLKTGEVEEMDSKTLEEVKEDKDDKDTDRPVEFEQGRD